MMYYQGMPALHVKMSGTLQRPLQWIRKCCAVAMMLAILGTLPCMQSKRVKQHCFAETNILMKRALQLHSFAVALTLNFHVQVLLVSFAAM